MPYNNDASFTDFSNLARVQANQLINQLHGCELAYDKWQSFRAGRNNATIATAEGRTETEIAEMDAAFAALVALKTYLENGTPVKSDYKYSLMKFV